MAKTHMEMGGDYLTQHYRGLFLRDPVKAITELSKNMDGLSQVDAYHVVTGCMRIDGDLLGGMACKIEETGTAFAVSGLIANLFESVQYAPATIEGHQDSIVCERRPNWQAVYDAYESIIMNSLEFIQIEGEDYVLMLPLESTRAMALGPLRSDWVSRTEQFGVVPKDLCPMLADVLLGAGYPLSMSHYNEGVFGAIGAHILRVGKQIQEQEGDI